MSQTNNYHDILLEDIQHKFELILEIVQPLTSLPQQFQLLDERLIVVESDVKIIKTIVSEHSKILMKHDQDITEIKSRLITA